METEGENLVPRDTVVDELRAISGETSLENTDHAFVKSIYLLGFFSYAGFDSLLSEEMLQDMQRSERVSAYVKSLLSMVRGSSEGDITL